MNINEIYQKWVTTKDKKYLNELIDALEPNISMEIYRYSGPKNLLYSKARILAINAIKTYDPTSKANLKSWVVTNLQQLNRYSKQLSPVYVPELSSRQAAAINTAYESLKSEKGREPTLEELADETGFSVNKIKKLRSKVTANLFSESLEDSMRSSDESFYSPAVSEIDKLDLSTEAVRQSLDDFDKKIYDYKIGKGGKVMSNIDIAKALKVSPAYVSQRSKYIADKILEAQKYV